ncbi:MAG TPA: hypothetical protein DEP63_02675 [Candidatus Magasanikbacteria bacterium]|nr:hypothetical protein [Candidatus Magasanikbacteria bacterium]HCC13627.1 hypothetical protein [Candidatus Magasanikbacteria bacterium]HCM53759.1 hypothetical protein [Candidatus Magasanikbacteria bacterium]
MIQKQKNSASIIGEMGVSCKYVHVVFWLTNMYIAVIFLYRFTGGENVLVFKVDSVDQLLVAIGTCRPSPQSEGPVVVKIEFPDGRTIVGAYYDVGGPKFHRPDAETVFQVFLDEFLGWFTPLVTRLLIEGVTFVTKTDSDGMTCVLEWSIEIPP